MSETYCLLLAAVPAADADRAAALERLRALGEVEALGVLDGVDPPRIGATLTSPGVPARETLADLSKVAGEVWACAYHATSDAAAIAHARAGEVVQHDPRRHVDRTEDPCAWMTTEALKGARSSADLRALIERADPERRERAEGIERTVAERERQRAHDQLLMRIAGALLGVGLVAYVLWWLLRK
jgi:hypothetical protein